MYELPQNLILHVRESSETNLLSTKQLGQTVLETYESQTDRFLCFLEKKVL